MISKKAIEDYYAQIDSSHPAGSMYYEDAQFWYQGVCRECFKKLLPIGDRRSNGAAHVDWDDRRYHKKCWHESNNFF